MSQPLKTALLFACAPLALAAQTNVLFVGNSFTHGHAAPAMTYNKAQITDANGTGYGGVPGIFKKLTTQAGLNYNITIEAVSGESLNYHVANKSAIIGDAKWNIVVLQEQSTTPLPTAHGGSPTSFMTGADALHDLVLSKNPAAQVVLYETWSSPYSANAQTYSGALQTMQTDLTNAYFTARYRSVRTSGKPDFDSVVRVGDAFMRAVDQGFADTDLSDGTPADMFYLWAEDNRHAGKFGCYLSAVLFFGKFTGLDPRTLTSATGTAAADLGINATQAQRIHQIAYETLALSDPAAPTPPTPGTTTAILNTLVPGVSPYNWNTATNWSAGALNTTQTILVNASSPATSIVANSTEGTPTTSVRSVGFDIGAATRAVQANATVTNTRTLNIAGGPDPWGGTSLIRLSAGTTGTVNFGTNTGFGTLVIAPAASGNIEVENATATLVFGATARISGSVDLTKTGAGKLVLLGANTFGAGANNVFKISSGTVFANTPATGTASATGDANVTVQANGFLAGFGQITPGTGKKITVESGGFIAPGNDATSAVGNLTLNSASTTAPLLTLAAGARLRFALNSASATDFQSNQLVVLSGAAGDIVVAGNVIDLIDLSSGALAEGDYTLISSTAANHYAGLSVDAQGFIMSGLSVGAGMEAYVARLKLVGGKVVLHVSPRPYTAWKNRVFSRAEVATSATSGDTATPAGDGLPNLLKYALNLDPKTPATPGQTYALAVSDGAADHLVFNFTQVLAATDISYVVEVSPDLNTWNSGPDFTETLLATTNPDGLTQNVSVQSLNATHRFARLRIVRTMTGND